MEIQELRYFLALGETLNFTRAAEKCHVSQPALTRAIQSLEDKLGAGPLVNRERNNTHLTEIGRIMRPYFEQVLRNMEEAKARAHDFVKMVDTTLTMGVMCTIGPVRLVDLFAGFNAHNQGISLYLHDDRADRLEESLGKGELDIAIYCKPEPPDERFHVLPLYTEPFVIAVAPGHPLARRKEVRLKDLDGLAYLSRANCEYAEHIDNIARGMNVDIRVTYRSERDSWIQAMVLAGLGYTMIPEYAVTLPGLVTRPLIEPKVVRTVGLVTVRGRPHSPAVGAFVREAQRYSWKERLQAPPLAEGAPRAVSARGGR
jgi:DNA-binding transcriptional LysR family regulator